MHCTRLTPLLLGALWLLVAQCSASTPAPSIPGWYGRNRTHAHTRLAINEFCRSNGTAASSNCSWVAPQAGRSPGSNLGHVAAESLAECQAHCCRVYGCLAVTFFDTSPGHLPCLLLDRHVTAATLVPSHGSVVTSIVHANRTGGNSSWTCQPVFEDAAQLLAGMGVPAFVRHSHTADEGTWWESATGPRESWHPLVQATGRNLPGEFLAKAKAAGVHVILYHYMKCNAYWAAAQPQWVQRWPNGTAITWPRGTGMSPCSAAWRRVYIGQVVELIDMGADAFFFDEFPASPGGDWGHACRVLFKEQNGGTPMPEALDANKTTAKLPYSAHRTVLDFMTNVTRVYFQELVDAIANATAGAGVDVHGIGPVRRIGAAGIEDGGPRGDFDGDWQATPAAAVALVGTHTTPAPDNGGLVYETTALASLGPQDVGKSEFATGTRTACKSPVLCYGEAVFARDVLAAFGWTAMRDAAQGRPPHLWIPFLRTSRQAMCTVFSTRSYGAIANPDHTEEQIPNHALFNQTYELSRKLDFLGDASTPLPADLGPLSYAAVVFSESSRDRWLPQNLSAAWDTLLFPTVGAFEALRREGLPTGLLVDSTLLPAARSPAKGGLRDVVRRWPCVIAPAPEALTGEVEAALEAYQSLGGKLIRLGASDPWADASRRPVLQEALVSKVLAAVGPPPLSSAVGGGGPDGWLHTTGLAAPSQPHRLVVMLSNNFTACIPTHNTGPLPQYPPDRSAVTVDVATPAGASVGTPAAINLLSGAALDVTEAPGGTAGRWRVTVGNVSQYAGVSLLFPS